LLDVAGQPALLALGLGEPIGRDQLDRDAGERLAELIERHVARAGRRVDDAHAALDDVVEHDEVVELPVQDRAGLDQLDLRDVDLDAAAGQAVALGGVEDRLGRHAIAADAHRVADLGELGLAAVVRHHHAERGGAAIGPLELLDERYGTLAGGKAEPLQGGEAFGDFLVVGCHGVVIPWGARGGRAQWGTRVASRRQSGRYFSNAGTSVARNGLDWILTSTLACMPWW